MSASQDDILSKLNEILKALQGGTAAVGRARAAVNDLGSATRDAAGATDELGRGLDSLTDPVQGVIDKEKELAQARKEAWEDLQKELGGITSLSEGFGIARRALDLYIKQNGKYANSVRNATAALKGAAAGAKLTAAAMKGIFSIGGSLISMFFDIGAAIVSIPFKFFNHIFDKAKSLMSGGTELAQAYENVRKVFGDTGSGLGKSVIDLGKNLTKGMIAPGLSARRVFGDVAEAINYANEVASASPEAFQALSDQFSGRNGLEILAMAKGLGIANEELVGFMDSAIATGQPVETMLTEVTKYAKGMGDAFGLNSKLISHSMAKASKDVKHFANATVKEIAQATVYAQKLGVSLESITGTLDAFNTFEQAADNVSKLSQAFGVNIDAMKMLEAKTPDEALDQIKQAFAAAGKSADQMNRQELQLIASSVGMDEATVRKTLSMKNAGAGLNNIKSVSNSLEKQTMDTSQALQKLSKDIEKLVKAGQAPEGKNFMEVFFTGFIEGIDKSEKMKKLIREVMLDIAKVRMEGQKLGESFMKYFPGFGKFIEGLTERLKDVPILFNNIRVSFEKFMRGLKDGSMTFDKLMQMLRGNFSDFMGGDNSEMMEGLSEMWKATKRILAEGINWVTDHLKDAFKSVLGFLRGDPTAAAGGLFGEAEKQVQPITDALKRMWNELKDPISDLLSEAFKAALNAMWEAWNNLDFGTKLKIYAAMFGPALVGGLANSLGSALFQRALGGALSTAAAGAATGGAGAGAAGAAGAAGKAGGLMGKGGLLRNVAAYGAKTRVPFGGANAARIGAVGRGMGMSAGAAGGLAVAGAGAAAAGGIYLAYDQYSELQEDLEYEQTDAAGQLIKGAANLKKEVDFNRLQDMLNDKTVNLREKQDAIFQALEQEKKIMDDKASFTAQYKDAAARTDLLRSRLEAIREEEKQAKLAFVEGTPEFAARLKKEKEEKDKLEAAAMLDRMGVGENITIENAEKTIKKIQDIADKIVSVNIEETLTKVREKFSKVTDWSVMTKGVYDKVKLAVESMGYVVALFEGFDRLTVAAQSAVKKMGDMGTPHDPSTPIGMLAKNVEGYVDLAMFVGEYLTKKGDWETVKTLIETASTTFGDLGNIMHNAGRASEGHDKIKMLDEDTRKKGLTTIDYFLSIAHRFNTQTGSFNNLGKLPPLIEDAGSTFFSVATNAHHLEDAIESLSFVGGPEYSTPLINFIKIIEGVVGAATGEGIGNSGIEDAGKAKTAFDNAKEMLLSVVEAGNTFEDNKSKLLLFENMDADRFETSAENFTKSMDNWISEVDKVGDPTAAKTKVEGIETAAKAISKMISTVLPLEGELNTVGGKDWTASASNLMKLSTLFSNDENAAGSIMANLKGIDLSKNELMKKVVGITTMTENIKKLTTGVASLPDAFSKIPDIRGKDALAALNSAIRDVNAINKGLLKMDLGEKTIGINLGKAVKNVTTRAFDPIKSTHAEITLTVNVHMSAKDIEQGIVKAPGSKIAAAIKTLAEDPTTKKQVLPGLDLQNATAVAGGETPPAAP